MPFAFFQLIRIERWWLYKAAPLMGWVYLFLFFSGEQNPAATVISFLSVITGMGGLGYLVNDYFDREKDKLSGKKNVFNRMEAGQVFPLAFFLVVLSAVPWFFLPLSKPVLLLLGLQIPLYFFYSHPAIRAKEWKYGGVLSDILYGHLIPFLIVVLTLATTTGGNFKEFNLFLAAGAVWNIFKGCRNIIVHQIEDRKFDIRSGTKTFVVHYGSVCAAGIINFMLLPLEMITFGFVLFAVSSNLKGFYLLFVFFLIFNFFSLEIWKKFNVFLARHKKRFFFFLNDFYEMWMPVAILIFLCLVKPWCVLLLVLHLFLFRKMFVRIKGDLRNVVAAIRYFR